MDILWVEDGDYLDGVSRDVRMWFQKILLESIVLRGTRLNYLYLSVVLAHKGVDRG